MSTVEIRKTENRGTASSPVSCLDCTWLVDVGGGPVAPALGLAREHVTENPDHRCHVEQLVDIYIEASEDS